MNDREQEGWAAYAAEQERHSETQARLDLMTREARLSREATEKAVESRIARHELERAFRAPLPFHDWRFDMDNPWSICARCGTSDAASELVALVAEAESSAFTQHIAGTCHLSEWSCSHCEAERA